jgi:hypothetical protein
MSASDKCVTPLSSIRGQCLSVRPAADNALHEVVVEALSRGNGKLRPKPRDLGLGEAKARFQPEVSELGFAMATPARDPSHFATTICGSQAKPGSAAGRLFASFPISATDCNDEQDD